MRRQKSKFNSVSVDATHRIDVSDSDEITRHASELAQLIYDVFMEEIVDEEEQEKGQTNANRS